MWVVSEGVLYWCYFLRFRMIRGIFNFQEKCKILRIRFGEFFEVFEFEREFDFDLGNVVVYVKQLWVIIMDEFFFQ